MVEGGPEGGLDERIFGFAPLGGALLPLARLLGLFELLGLFVSATDLLVGR